MSVFLRHSLLFMLAFSGSALATSPYPLSSQPGATNVYGQQTQAARASRLSPSQAGLTKPSLTTQQNRRFQQALKALYRIQTEPLAAPNVDHPRTFSQPVNSLTALMSLAPSAQHELEALLKRTAKQSNTHVKLAPVKSWQRAQQKIADKLQGRTSGLTDVVRGSLVATSIPELVSSYQALSQHAQVVQTKNRFKSPKASGYRDINLLLRLPSSDMIVEVQLHLDAISEIKNGPEHETYQSVQRIERLARSQKRPLTEQELDQIAQHKQASATLYQQAWQGYLSDPLMLSPIRLSPASVERSSVETKVA